MIWIFPGPPNEFKSVFFMLDLNTFLNIKNVICSSPVLHPVIANVKLSRDERPKVMKKNFRIYLSLSLSLSLCVCVHNEKRKYRENIISQSVDIRFLSFS